MASDSIYRGKCCWLMALNYLVIVIPLAVDSVCLSHPKCLRSADSAARAEAERIAADALQLESCTVGLCFV